MQWQAARDARWCCCYLPEREQGVIDISIQCHVTAARFLRAGREQVGWAVPRSVVSPAWRVIIPTCKVRFTGHVSTEYLEWRIRDTQARFQMWRGMMGNHDLGTPRPRGGCSRIKARASATRQLLAMAPRHKVHVPSSRYSSVLRLSRHRNGRGTGCPYSISPGEHQQLLRACHPRSRERLDSIARCLPLLWLNVIRWPAITSHERLPPNAPDLVDLRLPPPMARQLDAFAKTPGSHPLPLLGRRLAPDSGLYICEAPSPRCIRAAGRGRPGSYRNKHAKGASELFPTVGGRPSKGPWRGIASRAKQTEERRNVNNGLLPSPRATIYRTSTD